MENFLFICQGEYFNLGKITEASYIFLLIFSLPLDSQTLLDESEIVAI